MCISHISIWVAHSRQHFTRTAKPLYHSTCNMFEWNTYYCSICSDIYNIESATFAIQRYFEKYQIFCHPLYKFIKQNSIFRDAFVVSKHLTLKLVGCIHPLNNPVNTFTVLLQITITYFWAKCVKAKNEKWIVWWGEIRARYALKRHFATLSHLVMIHTLKSKQHQDNQSCCV